MICIAQTRLVEACDAKIFELADSEGVVVVPLHGDPQNILDQVKEVVSGQSLLRAIRP